MPKITRKHPHESIESMLRRFKRAVDKSGILKDLRKSEFFESPSEQRKRAKAAAIRRWNKTLSTEAEELAAMRKEVRQ